MGSVEIIVRAAALAKCETELNALYSTLAARRLRVSFASAKGGAAVGLAETAKELNELGEALALLVNKTASAVAYANSKFRETDKSLGEGLGGLGVQS